MTKRFNVAVCGAAGGIGQPLSLLLKNSPLVGKLVLFDVVPAVQGVAVDLSHIETPAQVLAFTGDMQDKANQEKQLREALKGMEIVVIPAGIPRKPGMSRDDLFNINAGIVKGLIEGVADVCPKAMILIISNPVNSTVPIAAEVMKKKGVYDPKRLFGVSTLDVVRANTFIAEKLKVDPHDINISVIGGHSGDTILPILHHLQGKLDEDTLKMLFSRIQNAGTEVVDAKAGAGSATLSMAYAGARFTVSVMRGLLGEENIVESSYVPSTLVPGVKYFASPVLLTTSGGLVKDFGKLSEFEQEWLETKVLPELKGSIEKGEKFVNP